MATTCTSCKCSKLKCGCQDSALTTPAPCPTPVDCPEAQPCSETFESKCIIYTGNNILCQQDVVVAQDTSVAEAINNIVDYFCNSTGSISENITCGDDTVVTAGSTFADAFEQVVDYFCQNSGGGTTTIVQAGANATVTSVTVGSITTYTVNAACPIYVEIARTDNDQLYFEAQVTGGIAPYTYVWSFPSTYNSTTTSPNNSMYELAPVPGFPNRMWIALNLTGVTNRFDSCASANQGFAGLLKLVVTDANGCKAKDFHFITDIYCQ